jgi:hypothetical protein
MKGRAIAKESKGGFVSLVGAIRVCSLKVITSVARFLVPKGTGIDPRRLETGPPRSGTPFRRWKRGWGKIFFLLFPNGKKSGADRKNGQLPVDVLSNLRPIQPLTLSR